MITGRYHGRQGAWGPTLVALAALAVPPHAGARPAEVPCGACVAVQVSAAQADEIARRGRPLPGLRVLVAGTGGPSRPVPAVLERLAALGAKTGLVLELGEPRRPPLPPPAAPLGPLGEGILLDASRHPPDAALAFAAKEMATALRAAGWGRIGLRLAGAPDDGSLVRGLAGYFDFFVLPGLPAPEALRALGTAERWTLWPAAEPAGLEEAARLPARHSAAAVLVELAPGPDALAHLLASPGAAAPGALASAAPSVRCVGDAACSAGEYLEVRGQRRLSVEEIVARHQAARARQEALVRTLVSTGSTVLTFEVPGFAAPFTVTAEPTNFTSGGATEVEQHDVRVNGLSLSTPGDRAPKLPLIDAERVAAPPLALALTEAYRYRLEGLSPLRGRPAYVVVFEPVARERSLAAGRAWIDATTFGLARLDATQAALPGPVVTSRQIDDFEMVQGGGETLWLPARSEIHQRYEAPGFAIPIHRVVSLASRRVNDPAFASRLDTAYRSDAVMLRDTPGGYRYLERPRGRTGEGGRVVQRGRADSVRTLAGGVTWDPNITVPLVFAGLSYVDLDLLGSGAQIDGFFGGTYGRVAWSGPPMGGSGWRVAGEASGMAFSYNERMFRNGAEQFGENVTQRPLHAAAGVTGPLAGAWRLRAAYEMDYVGYGRADSTAAGFRVPSSTPVHGLRVALERQRGPWVIAGWWNPAVRQHWTGWGFPGAEERPVRAFQRFGARAARSFAWSPRAVGRVEAVWMDGRGLDRFSRYGFGAFDNPLRGYPGESVRFDRGLALRSAGSWSASPALRLDLFADLGFVRDPGRSPRPRAYPGVGAGAQVPVPFAGMLAAAEWGYGFAGYNASGRQGTHVFRFSVCKVF